MGQPCANRGLSAEVYANLGCLGMTPLKPTPIWDGDGRGRGIAEIAVIADIARNRKTKAHGRGADMRRKGGIENHREVCVG